jgi:hypothetical protein
MLSLAAGSISWVLEYLSPGSFGCRTAPAKRIPTSADGARADHLHIFVLTCSWEVRLDTLCLSLKTFVLRATQQLTLYTNMKSQRSTTLVIICLATFAAASLNAATIPAGTTVTVSTVSLISSQTVAGRSFEAKLAKNVAVKGGVALKAGTKAFGKITSSRANPRKSGPLVVELASIEINGRKIPVKTNDIQPAGPPQTARQAQYGHTAGTTVVNPGTTLQFQLLQPVTF